MANKKLIQQLDKEFSIFIRRRYAINDIATCVTCGKKDHWKKLQAGHFMSRKHLSTRWDEDNVQVQCAGMASWSPTTFAPRCLVSPTPLFQKGI